MNDKPFEYKTSPHIRECKTKEEWDKECERWHGLTPEQRQKESADYERKLHEELAKSDAEWKKRKEEQQKKSQTPEEFFKNCDHPNSLENSEATIIWIVVMAVGTIFKGNWIVWIVATIIWWRYITRHSSGK